MKKIITFKGIPKDHRDKFKTLCKKSNTDMSKAGRDFVTLFIQYSSISEIIKALKKGLKKKNGNK